MAGCPRKRLLSLIFASAESIAVIRDEAGQVADLSAVERHRSLVQEVMVDRFEAAQQTATYERFGAAHMVLHNLKVGHMGTDAWRNWRAFNDGQQELENYDDELQSDVSFTGGPIDFGPFRLSTIFRRPGAVGPAIVVTGGVHTNLMPEIIVKGKLAKTNVAAYHGGTMTDEIAALASLELGVRVRVAGTLRLSGIHDNDEPRPPMYFEVPRLMQPGRPNRELLPRVLTRPANLGALSRLASFPTLDEADQVELVRAARSYASALWWANEDPNLAWLQLVTAVEAAATRRQVASGDPANVVEDAWPEMWAALESTDEIPRGTIASLLVPMIKATRRFLDFVTDYAPPPPDTRPDFDRLDWSKLRKQVGTVYGHRSAALHAGTPFPMPMLEEPRPDGSGVQEAPGGHNAGGLGGIWMADQTPMLLSTFEYIARGALLRWWDELAASAVVPGKAESGTEQAVPDDAGNEG
jgi:hypothetical protein